MRAARADSAEIEHTLAVARWLADALRHVHPLDATQVACAFALSRSPCHRLAIGAALALDLELLGDDVVLDHLIRDPEPVVREIARGAQRIRGGSHAS